MNVESLIRQVQILEAAYKAQLETKEFLARVAQSEAEMAVSEPKVPDDFAGMSEEQAERTVISLLALEQAIVRSVHCGNTAVLSVVVCGGQVAFGVEKPGKGPGKLLTECWVDEDDVDFDEFESDSF